MRLRTVLSKTASWQTYGGSARSGHCIGSNGSCGFYQALWAVREKVLAFVLVVGWARRSNREHYSRLPSYQMHRVPEISANFVVNLNRRAEDNFRGIEGIWKFKLIKLKLNGSGLSQPFTKRWKWRRSVADSTNTKCKDETCPARKANVLSCNFVTNPRRMFSRCPYFAGYAGKAASVRAAIEPTPIFA